MQALALFTEQDAIEQEERIFALEEEIVGQRLDRPDNWEETVNILSAVQLAEWARLEIILSNLR